MQDEIAGVSKVVDLGSIIAINIYREKPFPHEKSNVGLRKTGPTVKCKVSYKFLPAQLLLRDLLVTSLTGKRIL